MIGLSILIVVKALAEQQIERLAPLYDLEFPFFANLPYSLIRDPVTSVFTSNCDQVSIYTRHQTVVVSLRLRQ